MARKRLANLLETNQVSFVMDPVLTQWLQEFARQHSIDGTLDFATFLEWKLPGDPLTLHLLDQVDRMQAECNRTMA